MSKQNTHFEEEYSNNITDEIHLNRFGSEFNSKTEETEILKTHKTANISFHKHKIHQNKLDKLCHKTFLLENSDQTYSKLPTLDLNCNHQYKEDQSKKENLLNFFVALKELINNSKFLDAFKLSEKNSFMLTKKFVFPININLLKLALFETIVANNESEHFWILQLLYPLLSNKNFGQSKYETLKKMYYFPFIFVSNYYKNVLLHYCKQSLSWLLNYELEAQELKPKLLEKEYIDYDYDEKNKTPKTEEEKMIAKNNFYLANLEVELAYIINSFFKSSLCKSHFNQFIKKEYCSINFYDIINPSKYKSIIREFNSLSIMTIQDEIVKTTKFMDKEIKKTYDHGHNNQKKFIESSLIPEPLELISPSPILSSNTGNQSSINKLFADVESSPNLFKISPPSNLNQIVENVNPISNLITNINNKRNNHNHHHINTHSKFNNINSISNVMANNLETVNNKTSVQINHHQIPIEHRIHIKKNKIPKFPEMKMCNPSSFKNFCACDEIPESECDTKADKEKELNTDFYNSDFNTKGLNFNSHYHLRKITSISKTSDADPYRNMNKQIYSELDSKIPKRDLTVEMNQQLTDKEANDNSTLYKNKFVCINDECNTNTKETDYFTHRDSYINANTNDTFQEPYRISNFVQDAYNTSTNNFVNSSDQTINKVNICQLSSGNFIYNVSEQNINFYKNNTGLPSINSEKFKVTHPSDCSKIHKGIYLEDVEVIRPKPKKEPFSYVFKNQESNTNRQGQSQSTLMHSNVTFGENNEVKHSQYDQKADSSILLNNKRNNTQLDNIDNDLSNQKNKFNILHQNYFNEGASEKPSHNNINNKCSALFKTTNCNNLKNEEKNLNTIKPKTNTNVSNTYNCESADNLYNVNNQISSTLPQISFTSVYSLSNYNINEHNNNNNNNISANPSLANINNLNELKSIKINNQLNVVSSNNNQEKIFSSDKLADNNNDTNNNVLKVNKNFKLSSLKSFNFRMLKRENIDKKLLRKFRGYLQNKVAKSGPKYLKNKTESITDAFTSNFLKKRLYPPFKAEDGTFFKSFSTSYMIWFFSHSQIHPEYNEFIRLNIDNLTDYLSKTFKVDDVVEISSLKSYLGQVCHIYSEFQIKKEDLSLMLNNTLATTNYCSASNCSNSSSQKNILISEQQDKDKNKNKKQIVNKKIEKNRSSNVKEFNYYNITQENKEIISTTTTTNEHTTSRHNINLDVLAKDEKHKDNSISTPTIPFFTPHICFNEEKNESNKLDAFSLVNLNFSDKSFVSEENPTNKNS